MNLNIYLNFHGNTEEVVNFYREALNLPEPRIVRFKDLPQNNDIIFNISEVKDLVLYTELKIGQNSLQFSDIMPGMQLTDGNNMSISLGFDNEEEIISVYNKLVVDAKSIAMPLDETMWAELYAYFVDKFGVPWQLTYFGDIKLDI